MFSPLHAYELEMMLLYVWTDPTYNEYCSILEWILKRTHVFNTNMKRKENPSSVENNL
jgi:hypothetical protein